MPRSRPLLFAFALLPACGSSHDRLEVELGALRSEVAEMRARDQDRAEEMELLQNRIFVLESEPGVAAGSQAGAEIGRDLPVVAIAPEEPSPEIEEGPVEGDLPEVHGVAARTPARRRPELRATGATSPRRAPVAFTPPAPSAAGGESLGVVPIEGLPGPAASGPSAPSPYDDGVAKARARDYPGAVASLRRFLSESPGHGSAPAAQLLVAECLAAQGRHLDAIGEYERLLRRHPGHRTADATLGMGLSYLALGDRERARELLFQVVERHPGTPAARRATERVAGLEGRRTEGRP